MPTLSEAKNELFWGLEAWGLVEGTACLHFPLFLIAARMRCIQSLSHQVAVDFSYLMPSRETPFCCTITATIIIITIITTIITIITTITITTIITTPIAHIPKKAKRGKRSNSGIEWAH